MWKFKKVHENTVTQSCFPLNRQLSSGLFCTKTKKKIRKLMRKFLYYIVSVDAHTRKRSKEQLFRNNTNKKDPVIIVVKGDIKEAKV